MMNTPNRQEDITEQPLKKKHARFSIASFVVFVIVTCLLSALVVWSFTEIKRGNGEVVAIMLHFFLLHLSCIYVHPIILGIAGLFEQQRRKLFSVVSIILSLAMISGIIVMLAYA